MAYCIKLVINQQIYPKYVLARTQSTHYMTISVLSAYTVSSITIKSIGGPTFSGIDDEDHCFISVCYICRNIC